MPGIFLLLYSLLALPVNVCAVGYCVKGLLEVQVDGISTALPLSRMRVQASRTASNCEVQDRPSINLCWLSDSNLFSHVCLIISICLHVLHTTAAQ